MTLTGKSTPQHFFLVLLLFLAACSSPQQQEQPNEYATLETRLDSLFKTHINADDPGAAVLVAWDGAMVYAKGFGRRNVDAGEPITPTTNMRMASVSKQFTALCILSLVDEGMLSLADDAATYLPYPIFKGITIEQLANHTSGLPDYYEHFEEGWDRDNILENREVLEWLSTGPEPNFAPGESWEYSNTAYLMLALIVEEVSGMEFSQYAKEHVFNKAGMTRTNYFNLANPIEIPERAFCYELDSSGTVEQVDGFFMNGVMGDGAVYTSLQDYFNYDQALRNESILSPETHALIFEPSSEVIRDSVVVGHYAMGWGVTDSTASHSGGWFGTNTYVRRYLNKPLTFAIFMNRNTLRRDGLVNKTDSLIRSSL